MSLMLLIDTALETASVAIAREGELLAARENIRQNDHAAWLHKAMQDLMNETNISFSALEAVGVTDGPGSYTGLRVGLSAAKGICYAQRIPLITVSSLEVLAAGVADEAEDLIIALIDARRDEVYAAVYDRTLKVILPEQPMIVTPASFQELPIDNKIILTGSGAKKTLEKIKNKCFMLIESKSINKKIAVLTYKKMFSRSFSELARHEPNYIKNFYLDTKGK